ncbi:packaged DNA stabilization protein [Sphingomonas faeni]|uniref:packaged DNA stabilization protein n=1 Tax=Sphingomonas faeni TaxID=185950 RepID=UPI003344BCA8
MIFPLSLATYKRADLPRVRFSNVFAETAQTVASKVILLPRPGLSSRSTVGTGPVRGMFYQPGALDSKLFAVSGGRLFAGTVDTGAIDGDANVQMAAADTALLITNGMKLYRLIGATLSAIAFPDDAGVSSVVYLGGYAVAARKGSRRFYFTLDSATWDGLDYLSAEQSTDPIVGLCVVVDQLWVFCERHTEIFFLTGDADAPFQRVQGRLFDKGALSRDAIVKMDNTVFWVGSDSIVYRGENTPLRVSDHGIEERIALSDASSVLAWSFTWRGHLFYVLQLATETLLFDASTQLWAEASSYGLPRWRARFGLQVGREIVAGDDVSGQLWTLTEGLYRDGTDIVRAEWTLLLNDAAFVDNLLFDMSVGAQADPNSAAGLLEIRTSRDGGRTWSEWRQTELGRQGAYRTGPGFNRLGLIDRSGMVVHCRLTDDVPRRLSNARVNDMAAGRSR